MYMLPEIGLIMEICEEHSELFIAVCSVARGLRLTAAARPVQHTILSHKTSIQSETFPKWQSLV